MHVLHLALGFVLKYMYDWQTKISAQDKHCCLF